MEKRQTEHPAKIEMQRMIIHHIAQPSIEKNEACRLDDMTSATIFNLVESNEVNPREPIWEIFV
jgi:hypothetical protein